MILCLRVTNLAINNALSYSESQVRGIRVEAEPDAQVIKKLKSALRNLGFEIIDDKKTHPWVLQAGRARPLQMEECLLVHTSKARCIMGLSA